MARAESMIMTPSPDKPKRASRALKGWKVTTPNEARPYAGGVVMAKTEAIAALIVCKALGYKLEQV